MKKIKSLFKRDYDGNRKVYNEIVPGCEWVAHGEGVATRKFNGTPCAIINGKFYKRYDVKDKAVPAGAIPCQKEPDIETGHFPHWIEIVDNKENKWFMEGYYNLVNAGFAIDGTYELCGPKINGNPEKFENHFLVPHGCEQLVDCPRIFWDIKEYLKDKDIEGIVWHRDNGDMVKIKKKDFDYSK